MAKKFHFRVTLTKPDKTKAFIGVHNAEQPARLQARQRATLDNEDPDTMDETVVEIYGPAPRTFQGNDNAQRPKGRGARP